MNLFIWILYFILSVAIVYVVDFLLRSKRTKRFLIITSIIKIVVAIIFTVLVMAGPVFMRPIQPIMISLYVVMMMDGIVEFIFAFAKTHNFMTAKVVSFFIVLAFFVYGTTNMSVVKTNYHVIETDKISNDYKFAYICDVHYGSPQSSETVREYIEQIKNLELDFVVLAGDITDEYTTKEEMEELYSFFNGFTCPVYFIYGNHDTQGNGEFAGGIKYTVEELENAIASNGIIILKDEYVRIGDEITMLGRSDYSDKEGRINSEDLVNPNPNDFQLTIEHQPFDEETIKSLGADLQVSGHTHAGQFSPLNLFYGLIVGPTYGDYTIGNTHLIVSGGFAGWRVPFRSDHVSEYEIITIKSTK